MPPRLYAADWVITMDPTLGDPTLGDPTLGGRSPGGVIADGAVAVSGDRIEAVGTATDLAAQFPDAPVERLERRVLLPGLINTHCHAGLLRGTAEGLPVWDWLQQFIDPMHRVLRPEEAAAASRLAYAESLLAGTTTIVDMWRYLHGGAQAAADLGIRAVLVPYVAEHPDHDYFETLATNEALIADWQDGADGRIRVWVGLEHLFYATDDALARAIDLAKAADTGLHTHANEARFDVEEGLKRFGKRPILRMAEIGLLDAPKVLLAHCVWLDDAERQALADHDVGVAHNPVSNMKLASGAAEIGKLLDKGIAVGLGTDGEKENNNLDLFEEMKTASLLAKLSTLDAAAFDAWDVLRSATVEGARALGMDARIGSLTPGKQADMIAVRLDTPRMTPALGGRWFNLHHNLVHAVRGGDVDLTMVAGQVVTRGGTLLTGDLSAILADVQDRVPGLFDRRQAWLDGQTATKRGTETATGDPSVLAPGDD